MQTVTLSQFGQSDIRPAYRQNDLLECEGTEQPVRNGVLAMVSEYSPLQLPVLAEGTSCKAARSDAI